MKTPAIACFALAVIAAAPLHSSPHVAETGLVGGVAAYTVARGDTLRSIGARYGVDVAALIADNDLPDPSRLVVGQVLRVDHRHVVPTGVGPGGPVVNLPQRMLFLASDGRIDGYPVAVGRSSWRTPVGPFTVVSAERNPTWDVPVSILEEARRAGRTLPGRVPPGPDNPLGKFWLGLSIPGVGIHGTNAPSSIYGAVTHGCIRMHPDDIARVFPRVPVGSLGRIVYEPLLLTASDADVFLEVHADVYRRARGDVRQEARDLAARLGLTDRIDWIRADRVVEARHGLARSVSHQAGS